MAHPKKTARPIGSRTWRIHISLESRKLGIPLARIRRVLATILALAESDISVAEVSEVHLALISDRKMRVLNREHRGKDKPTDVLSFPQYTPQEISGRARRKLQAPSPYLGDLVISTDTTLKQAQEFGVNKHAELVRLLVHGVLHLCGYDHEKVSARAAQRMRRRERAIRQKILGKEG